MKTHLSLHLIQEGGTPSLSLGSPGLWQQQNPLCDPGQPPPAWSRTVQAVSVVGRDGESVRWGLSSNSHVLPTSSGVLVRTPARLSGHSAPASISQGSSWHIRGGTMQDGWDGPSRQVSTYILKDSTEALRNSHERLKPILAGGLSSVLCLLLCVLGGSRGSSWLRCQSSPN